MTRGTSQELASRLAAGRTDALRDVYEALGPLVLSYVKRYVPSQDAEDVVQRVFVEVWRSASRYDPSRSLEAWVLGIARKRSIDYLRRRDQRSVPTDQFGEVPGDDGRRQAEFQAEAQVVQEALEQLPVEQQRVLALAYYGGFTQSEIARHLGIPLGTVKARTSRGLHRLSGLLRRRLGDG